MWENLKAQAVFFTTAGGFSVAGVDNVWLLSRLDARRSHGRKTHATTDKRDDIFDLTVNGTEFCIFFTGCFSSPYQVALSECGAGKESGLAALLTIAVLVDSARAIAIVIGFRFMSSLAIVVITWFCAFGFSKHSHNAEPI